MQLQDIERERLFLGPVKAICDPQMPNLCCKPYPGHKKGCPNFNKKAGCPPNVIYFPDYYEENVHIITVRFDFDAYLSMMRERHPTWTDKALRNVLYWQGHIRKELRDFAANTNIPLGYQVIKTPEAMGVNLTETCKQAGIELEWPPMKNTYAIVLVAKKKNKIDTWITMVDKGSKCINCKTQCDLAGKDAGGPCGGWTDDKKTSNS